MLIPQQQDCTLNKYESHDQEDHSCSLIISDDYDPVKKYTVIQHRTLLQN